MEVGIVIPADPATYDGDGDRARNLRHVLTRLSCSVPSGWTIRVAVWHEQPWCKAAAVQGGIDVLDDCRVIVVHDADVLVAPVALEHAVGAVRDGGVPWAIPHGDVLRLDPRSTESFIAGNDAEMRLVRPPYFGVEGGGIVVVRADVWQDCPMDTRFVGWGSEDEAWGYALRTLYGEPRRGNSPLFHLFHPHPAPGARRSPLIESTKLHRAYKAYRRDPDRMRALIASGQ